MIRWSRRLVLVGVVALLGSVPVWAQDGAALYAAKCALCHGASGRGDGPSAGRYTPPPTDFTRSASRTPAMTEKKLVLTIQNGHVDMPPMDQNPAEAHALARYVIRTFQPQPSPQPQP